MELGVLHSIIGEVWKPIEGFPNYAVSNRGRVYSFTREEVCNGHIRMRQGRILIPRLGKQGYYYVVLRDGIRNRTKKVHRLVAEAFLANPEHLECVNHKDECRTNNFVENLEWCTTAYNVTYGGAIRKTQERFIETGWSKSVEQYDKEGNFLRRFSSVNEAARHIGRKPGGITNCCKGNRKIAYGFIWKYGKEVA